MTAPTPGDELMEVYRRECQRERARLRGEVDVEDLMGRPCSERRFMAIRREAVQRARLRMIVAKWKRDLG